MSTFEELLAKYGKYCPKCGSGQITSNSKPLRHRCLDCDHKFLDKEAVIGLEAAKKVKNKGS
jgi:uncharacterized protein (DUF983 family)